MLLLFLLLFLALGILDEIRSAPAALQLSRGITSFRPAVSINQRHAPWPVAIVAAAQTASLRAAEATGAAPPAAVTD
jgi:hypothetical protein